MFLAHFTGWSYRDLMLMSTYELITWHKEAIELHNYLNTSTDG